MVLAVLKRLLNSGPAGIAEAERQLAFLLRPGQAPGAIASRTLPRFRCDADLYLQLASLRRLTTVDIYIYII